MQGRFKLLLAGLLLLGGIFWFVATQAAEPLGQVNLYLFHREDCPHCQQEIIFLKTLEEAYGARLKVSKYEIFSSRENLDLFKTAGRLYNVDVSGVPVTVIGDQVIIGYGGDLSTGSQIKKAVDRCLSAYCPDLLGDYLASQTVQPEPQSAKEPDQPAPSWNNLPEYLNLPLLGQVKIRALSLPALTIAIGLMDGFNPCAMWVLMFLISLLLGMKNRRRMWLLGGTFILVSGLVYFLFMAAWLNLLIFLGFLTIVRLVIGGVALVTGGYNLREYWIHRPGCKVVKSESRRRIFEQLKAITQKPSLFMALGGIILLAFAVNLVELLCSVGLPAVYTQVLTLSALPILQYYLYLVAYVFFFMLDDLLVFLIAMLTLRAVGLSDKYSRFSSLIGGLIILIIGLLIIFKPGWLMFG